MTKLTKAQEKRFKSIPYLTNLDTVEELARKVGHDGYIVDAIKLKVADELARQREEIVRELENMAIETPGNSAKTLDQAIKTIKEE